MFGAMPLATLLLILSAWSRVVLTERHAPPTFTQGVATGADSSCVGHCGSYADTCWCNDACVAHGDCCDDYKQECKQPSGSCPKCDGKYSCDEWIAWDSTKFSCPELEKDWGCDCSGCKCSSGGVQASKIVV
mmetsp:Transcript_106488/g.299260  ORF Transcript_106488/g.299260 Transcript_106488/m.299260 type:complete len:132 (-) Transcript_106488:152-547(-)